MKIILHLVVLLSFIFLNYNRVLCQSNCDSLKSSFVIVEKPPKLNYKLAEFEQLLNNNFDLSKYSLYEKNTETIIKSKPRSKSKSTADSNSDIKCLIFNINCNGEMYDFKTHNIQDSLFSENLIDFAKKNCIWKPGFQNGQAIDFHFTFRFRIIENKIVIINDNLIE